MPSERAGDKPLSSPWNESGHGVWLYACGEHVKLQCRCIEGHRNRSVTQTPCPFPHEPPAESKLAEARQAAPEPQARLRLMAEQVVDDWDTAEGECMRDGYRQTMERLIHAKLVRVVRDSAKYVAEEWALDTDRKLAAKPRLHLNDGKDQYRWIAATLRSWWGLKE